MLFVLSVSILGSMIAIRMFSNLIERNLFERSEMTKIGTVYFCSVIMLAVGLPHGYLSLWSAVFIPLAVFAFALASLVRRRAMRFHSAIRVVLASIALKMKSGRSFRQSLSEVTSESDASLRAKLSEIGSVVVFSQQNDSSRRTLICDPFIAALVFELREIDRQPHAASRRLAVLREKLRIEDDFRRKSGQVLARIRAQSLVMTGLYVALALFMAWKFDWRANLRIFASSALLFCLGSLWMWCGGRSLKWKV